LDSTATGTVLVLTSGFTLEFGMAFWRDFSGASPGAGDVETPHLLLHPKNKDGTLKLWRELVPFQP